MPQWAHSLAFHLMISLPGSHLHLMDQMARINLLPLGTIEIRTTSPCPHSTWSATSFSIVSMNSAVSRSLRSQSNIIVSGSNLVTGNDNRVARGCNSFSKLPSCSSLAVMLRNIDANSSRGMLETVVKAACSSLINHCGGHTIHPEQLTVDCCWVCGAKGGWTWLVVNAELPACCGRPPSEPELDLVRIFGWKHPPVSSWAMVGKGALESVGLCRREELQGLAQA